MELQESPNSSTKHSRTTQEDPLPNRIQLRDESPTATAPHLSQPTPNARKPRSNFFAWWSSRISRTIPHGPGIRGGDPRDYLALERTFLGWARTSLALVSLGVLVTQLFVLDDVNRRKGEVLGCVLTVAGMVVMVAGAIRYFREQERLVQGKATVGGWEAIGVLVVVGGCLVALLLATVIGE